MSNFKVGDRVHYKWDGVTVDNALKSNVPHESDGTVTEGDYQKRQGWEAVEFEEDSSECPGRHTWYVPESMLTRLSDANDNVDHPAHYTQGDVECIDAIKSALTEEEFRGYCKGNALKYTWRERMKGGAEDLEKACWYLGRLAKTC